MCIQQMSIEKHWLKSCCIQMCQYVYVLMQTIWQASNKQARKRAQQGTASKASGQADQPAQQASTAST